MERAPGFQPVFDQLFADAKGPGQLWDGEIPVFPQLLVVDQQANGESVGLNFISVHREQRVFAQKRRIGLGMQNRVAQLVSAGEKPLGLG